MREGCSIFVPEVRPHQYKPGLSGATSSSNSCTRGAAQDEADMVICQIKWYILASSASPKLLVPHEVFGEWSCTRTQVIGSAFAVTRHIAGP